MNGFTLDPNSWGIFTTAQGIGADPSYDYPRTTETVPSNAVQSMQPVDAAADNGGWSDFWRGTTQQLLGYAIAKDAAKSGLRTNASPVTVTPSGNLATGTTAARPMGTLLTVGLVAVAVLVIVKVAK